MRIQEAQSLMLADRNMPIEQIASEVGFTSQSTFSSTFKKQVGISPNAWRNQQL
jgi:AraC-like DNA-binding protein